MSHTVINFQTRGEKFYDITDTIKATLHGLFDKTGKDSGLLCIFNPHTSMGLTISEAYDPSAKADLESFLKHLAKRNLPFIQHTCEGPDDSPSHMKSMLTSPSLTLIVEKGELVMGTWQGIYLCEFRDHPHNRKIHLKFLAD